MMLYARMLNVKKNFVEELLNSSTDMRDIVVDVG